MYGAFRSTFSCTRSTPKAEKAFRIPELVDGDFYALIEEFGGCSFDSGLYRVMDGEAIQKWDAYVGKAFPESIGKFYSFSFDWMGRIYALDLTRLAGERHRIVMFEPGSGEILRTPATMEHFHNSLLLKQNAEIISRSYFDDWRKQGKPTPNFGECVGFRRPLFWGGADSLANMELTNMEVYWGLLGQMIAQTKHLPVGARVKINGAKDNG